MKTTKNNKKYEIFAQLEGKSLMLQSDVDYDYFILLISGLISGYVHKIKKPDNDTNIIFETIIKDIISELSNRDFSKKIMK